MTGGAIGEAPDYYYVIRAAEILNCSALDLDSDPRKWMWIFRAFAVRGAMESAREQLNQPYH